MTVRAIVLAAGAGTRMKSDIPKVLQPVAGKPLLPWILDAVRAAEPDQIMVVLGHGSEDVAAILPEDVDSCIQEEQLGTGHATQIALETMGEVGKDIVLVVPGDTPLIQGETLAHLVATHRNTGAAVSLLTAEVTDPTGYGRVLRDAWDKMNGVVEHGDASLSQLQIREINAGIYAFNGELLAKALTQVEDDNTQGEFYLTDVVSILSDKEHILNALKADRDEVVGVNDPDQLAEAARLLRKRINSEWMRKGVWMLDPERVYVDAGVEFGEGVRIYPDVHLEGQTRVGDDTEIGPGVFARDAEIGHGCRVWYSVLRQARVGDRSEVGPFASLRAGTVLEEGAKVGTFVELKQTTLGPGAKVPHLSYMGDARVGRETNIGAGTITCNYDGFEKHETVIGERAFIGSDTMLVAPVTVGDEAVTGAGSVITKDVSPGSLAVERAAQKEVPGYAARRRAKHEKEGEERD